MGAKMKLKSEKGRKKGIQKSMLKIDAEKNRRYGLLGSIFVVFEASGEGLGEGN